MERCVLIGILFELLSLGIFKIDAVDNRIVAAVRTVFIGNSFWEPDESRELVGGHLVQLHRWHHRTVV